MDGDDTVSGGFIETSEYSRIHQLMPIPCVDLAILVERKVLLVRRVDEPDAGRLWIPGGRIFKGESFRDAAIRIATEEVGLLVDVGQTIYQTNIVFKSDPFGHGCGTHTVSFVFLCRKISGNVRLNSRHTEFLWWDGRGEVDGAGEGVLDICRVAISEDSE